MANLDFTNAILAQVHGALKPLGFRKNGSTFTRDVEDVVQIVNIQKSSTNDKMHVKVTANLGVWVKALAPVRAGVPRETSGQHIGACASEKSVPSITTRGGLPPLTLMQKLSAASWLFVSVGLGCRRCSKYRLRTT